jgi:hypothetical protein
MQMPWVGCWLSDSNFDRVLGYGSLKCCTTNDPLRSSVYHLSPFEYRFFCGLRNESHCIDRNEGNPRNFAF